MQFWDPRNGTTQLMLQGHKNSGTDLAFPCPLLSIPNGLFQPYRWDCCDLVIVGPVADLMHQ